MMQVLLLGHTYQYIKHNCQRCCPIDINVLLKYNLHLVDYLCEENDADFVYNLYRNKNALRPWEWSFAKDNYYDIIVDCMGSINWNSNKDQYKYIDDLLTTIKRVLKPNGIFISSFGIYTKTSETLTFEPKTRNGYKYIY
jgi:SAM-dependent methyltransferase